MIKELKDVKLEEEFVFIELYENEHEIIGIRKMMDDVLEIRYKDSNNLMRINYTNVPMRINVRVEKRKAE